MERVRVVAPLGASLRGPAVIRLSNKQAKRREAFLAPFRADKPGEFILPGDIAVQFKRGEEFAIDKTEGRLNPKLFEVVQKPGGKVHGNAGEAG